jgi:hypothetical protein
MPEDNNGERPTTPSEIAARLRGLADKIETHGVVNDELLGKISEIEAMFSPTEEQKDVILIGSSEEPAPTPEQESPFLDMVNNIGSATYLSKSPNNYQGIVQPDGTMKAEAMTVDVTPLNQWMTITGEVMIDKKRGPRAIDWSTIHSSGPFADVRNIPNSVWAVFDNQRREVAAASGSFIEMLIPFEYSTNRTGTSIFRLSFATDKSFQQFQQFFRQDPLWTLEHSFRYFFSNERMQGPLNANMNVTPWIDFRRETDLRPAPLQVQAVWATRPDDLYRYTYQEEFS